MPAHDDEIIQLKAEVHCGTVLERLPPPWTLDRRQSTRRALKYRRSGEILIISHDGRGWWDPHDAHAKGDVFSLVQRLDPSLGFGQARGLLRQLAGIFPRCSGHGASSCGERPRPPVDERWAARPLLTEGSATWAYLTRTRGLPRRMLLRAVAHQVLREGPNGSAWFAHRRHDGQLTGIEMRGPQWRGFSADSEKSLFRLPGGTTSPTRLVVVEAPIDALSLAALEGPWVDTLYLATAGGMGPATVAALEALLAERAGNPDARLVAATDADLAGDRHAGFLAELAKAAGVSSARLRPPRGLKDWNDLLVRAEARAGGLAAMTGVPTP